eukprot:Sspe_Gene.18534::Locus_6666_Transcript_1_1_Confidence_1.000_Length_4033::g.18534::m.18534
MLDEQRRHALEMQEVLINRGAELDEVKEEAHAAKQGLKILRLEIDSKKKMVDQLQAILKERNETIDVLREVVEERGDTISKLEDHIKMQSEVNKVDDVSHYQEVIRDLERQLKEKGTSEVRYKGEAAANAILVVEREKELNECQRKLDEGSAALERLELALVTTREELSNAKKELQAATQESADLRGRFLRFSESEELENNQGITASRQHHTLSSRRESAFSVPPKNHANGEPRGASNVGLSNKHRPASPQGSSVRGAHLGVQPTEQGAVPGRRGEDREDRESREKGGVRTPVRQTRGGQEVKGERQSPSWGDDDRGEGGGGGVVDGCPLVQGARGHSIREGRGSGGHADPLGHTGPHFDGHVQRLNMEGGVGDGSRTSTSPWDDGRAQGSRQGGRQGSGVDHSGLQQALDSAQGAVSNLRAENERLRSELHRLNEMARTSEGSVSGIKRALASHEVVVARFEREITDLRDALAEQEDLNRKLIEEKYSFDRAFESMQAEVQAYRESQEEIFNLRCALAAEEASSRELEATAANTQAALEMSKASYKELQVQAVAARRQLSQAQHELETLRAMTEMTDREAEWKAVLAANQEALKSAEDSQGHLREVVRHNASILQNLKAEAAEHAKQCRLLQTHLAARSREPHRVKVVDGVVQLHDDKDAQEALSLIQQLLHENTTKATTIASLQGTITQLKSDKCDEQFAHGSPPGIPHTLREEAEAGGPAAQYASTLGLLLCEKQTVIGRLVKQVEAAELANQELRELVSLYERDASPRLVHQMSNSRGTTPVTFECTKCAKLELLVIERGTEGVALERELESMAALLHEKSECLALQEGEMEAMEERLGSMQQAVLEAEGKMEEVNGELDETQREARGLLDENNRLQQCCDELSRKVRYHEEAVKEMEEEAAAARRAQERAERRALELSNELEETRREAEGQSTVLQSKWKELLSEHEEGFALTKQAIDDKNTQVAMLQDVVTELRFTVEQREAQLRDKEATVARQEGVIAELQETCSIVQQGYRRREGLIRDLQLEAAEQERRASIPEQDKHEARHYQSKYSEAVAELDELKSRVQTILDEEDEVVQALKEICLHQGIEYRGPATPLDLVSSLRGAFPSSPHGGHDQLLRLVDELCSELSADPPAGPSLHNLAVAVSACLDAVQEMRTRLQDALLKERERRKEMVEEVEVAKDAAQGWEAKAEAMQIILEKASQRLAKAPEALARRGSDAAPVVRLFTETLRSALKVVGADHRRGSSGVSCGVEEGEYFDHDSPGEASLVSLSGVDDAVRRRSIAGELVLAAD